MARTTGLKVSLELEEEGPPKIPNKTIANLRGSIQKTKSYAQEVQEGDFCEIHERLRYDEKKVILLQAVDSVLYYLHHPSSRPYRQRNDIQREIIQTERYFWSYISDICWHYMRSLMFVVQKYRVPLESLAKEDNPIIPLEDVNILFSNIEEIKNFNKTLLSKLEHSAREWPSWNNIGKIFIEMAPFMKIYGTYIINFEQVQQVLEKHKEDSKWRKFKEQAKADELGANLDLDSFLIMPIQRLPRYELLLRELLKLTPHDHTDYENILLAYEKVQLVNSEVNELKRASEIVQQKVDEELKHSKSLLETVRRTMSFRKPHKGDISGPSAILSPSIRASHHLHEHSHEHSHDHKDNKEVNSTKGDSTLFKSI